MNRSILHLHEESQRKTEREAGGESAQAYLDVLRTRGDLRFGLRKSADQGLLSRDLLIFSNHIRVGLGIPVTELLKLGPHPGEIAVRKLQRGLPGCGGGGTAVDSPVLVHQGFE